MKTARVIAFYLPQFHPIEENNRFWGEGFTEWTHVKKALPLYVGHQQPKLPGAFGYYDLNDESILNFQSDLAVAHGIEGFCFWHYWFGNGYQVLEKPIKKLLQYKGISAQFCFSWANESWKGRAHGVKANQIMIQQNYLGLEDDVLHFNWLRPFFDDERYIQVDGKPLFLIYKPKQIPNLKNFLNTFRELALKAKYKGLHIIGFYENDDDLKIEGFDGWVPHLPKIFKDKIKPYETSPDRYLYEDFLKAVKYKNISETTYPVVLPNWDNTPRSQKEGFVIENSTPEAFGEFLDKALQSIQNRPIEKRLVFVKSWNEWAEGNFLEPDSQYGNAYLEEIKRRVLI